MDIKTKKQILKAFDVYAKIQKLTKVLSLTPFGFIKEFAIGAILKGIITKEIKSTIRKEENKFNEYKAQLEEGVWRKILRNSDLYEGELQFLFKTLEALKKDYMVKVEAYNALIKYKKYLDSAEKI